MRVPSPIPVFLLLICCGGCGNPSRTVATVTPDQATVQPGGTVTLVGSLRGDEAHPALAWWIEESKELNSKNTCGKLDTAPKDFTGCPFGFVMYHPEFTIASTATYFAPQTPGTYHVVVTFGWLSYADWVETTATASIVVTP